MMCHPDGVAAASVYDLVYKYFTPLGFELCIPQCPLGLIFFQWRKDARKQVSRSVRNCTTAGPAKHQWAQNGSIPMKVQSHYGPLKTSITGQDFTCHFSFACPKEK
jgi:hypothetical protein